MITDISLIISIGRVVLRYVLGKQYMQLIVTHTVQGSWNVCGFSQREDGPSSMPSGPTVVSSTMIAADRCPNPMELKREAPIMFIVAHKSSFSGLVID